MIRSHSQKQLSLAAFDWPFQTKMDENNRWVVLSRCIPWDPLAEGYHRSLSANKGRPAKDARLVIGAVIIKHKLCLSDEETVAQIQENPYLQYFVGLAGYQSKVPFVPSLFVEIRKRMGADVFEVFHQAIIDSVEDEKQKKAPVSKTPSHDDSEPPTSNVTIESPSSDEMKKDVKKRGKLILDATVAPQAIRYPTDLNLLNEAREVSELIIDKLYPETSLKSKPRTYRQQARKAYLGLVKQRRPRANVRRQGIKKQLQYLKRNFQHIQSLLSHWPTGERLPLSNGLLYRYWVIQHLMADHVHICISIPPKYSVSNVIGYMKGKSTITIARRFKGKQRDFSGEHFWARGYYVSTVGLDEEMVREYIRNQEEEDVRRDQLVLGM